MIYSVYLSEEALKEEAEAYFFYENKVNGLGERFLNEVESALTSVAQHPEHYSYSDNTKTIRDVALTTFPFVIIFEVQEEQIVVYHIHNTKKELK